MSKKEEYQREIASLLQRGVSPDEIPAELLDPFDEGETVLALARGGTKIAWIEDGALKTRE